MGIKASNPFCPILRASGDRACLAEDKMSLAKKGADTMTIREYIDSREEDIRRG